MFGEKALPPRVVPAVDRLRSITLGLAAVTLLADVSVAAVESVEGGFRFHGANHSILISSADGSIISLKDGSGNEIATGSAAGLWSVTHYDGASHDSRGMPVPTSKLTAAACLGGGASFMPTLEGSSLDLVYADSARGLSVTVTVADRADGVDFSAELSVAPGADLTVLGIDLPAGLRFDPSALQRFIAPNHSSDGVGMAFNKSFFETQTEDNAATWKEVPQADGGLGYRTLYGSGLVFETSDPVALDFTSTGTNWLGAAVQARWSGGNAVVNRPPASGQWDLLLIDSPNGPYFSGSKLGGGAGAGYLMRIGGNVNGEPAVSRSLDVVSAAIQHLGLNPGGRNKIGVLSMERGPVIGESWPSEVRIDQWFQNLNAALAGFEIVAIRDYAAMNTALASAEYLAVVNPYGENIPASLTGGVSEAVNAVEAYVHGGGNWFEVGGHPFFFALQPVLHYSVEMPYPAAFADFLQLETDHGNASLFGVQPVLADPENPWIPSALFVPGNLAWGADATGGHFMRGFVAHVQPAETWRSPAVRLAIGHPAVEALGLYSAANGFSRGLEDKIPSAPKREAFRKSPLLRIIGTANELTARIPQLPSPSLLHITQYLKGGFDKEYPDHLPVNPGFGTEAEFREFLSAANGAGLLTMPYTNPTFWGVDPKGPTWTAIGNDDPLLLNLNGAVNFEEYFGEGGFTATPWHPAVRAANEKTIDLFNGDPGNQHPEADYQVDFLFQDQVGARSWQYDINPQSPSPSAYIHGLIALNAEDSGKMPVSTENGFDRLINFESQFCGLAWGLAPTPGAPFWRRYLSDRYDPATWEIFPLAQHLAHDKVAFTYNNLGASTSTNETVAWALGLGYGMTYFFDESDLNNAGFREWIAWLSRVQKSVAARYIGGGVTAFQHRWGDSLSVPDNGSIEATYGSVDLVANLDAQNLVSGSRTLAPHGFVATSPGMIAARMIEPGGSEPVNFVVESDSNGNADFWIHSLGGQDVTIELPPGMNGSHFVTLDGGAAVEKTVTANQLTVTLPTGAETGTSYLWHGTVSHFTYVINPSDNVTITGYAGPDDMVIPETLDDLPVVEIGAGALRDRVSLKSASIANTVTTIADHCFAGCTGLIQCNIPDSVAIIGSHAFDGCSGLSAIDLGAGVSSIGFAAFQGCTGLTGISIPDSVTSLGGNAFFNCTGLLDVSIGSGIELIPAAAFQGCISLTGMVIPSNVTGIGDFAFFGCSALSHVDFGNGVTSIGLGAFQFCEGLERITIPASVTYLGGYALAGGGSLREAYFLGNPPAADPGVFDGQANLGIFHLPAATGWANPWHGLPTAPWDPVLRDATYSNGVFSFDVTGSADFSCIVEGSWDLVDWSALGTITLGGGEANFVDATAPPDREARFYRLRVP